MYVTEIPPVNDLMAVDNCNNITASWSRIVGPCENSSYAITLSSSTGDTMGPFTTPETFYIFNNTIHLSAIININVVAVHSGYIGSASVATAKVSTTSEYGKCIILSIYS